MAVVQGIKEKVHLPIYDCFTVKPGEQLRDVPDASNTNVLKFFVNVQGKTKLQTNLQSASLLPHYNTFEARAMRVVISDLPPEFSENKKITGLKTTAAGTPPLAPEPNVAEVIEAFKTIAAGPPPTVTFTGGSVKLADVIDALNDQLSGPAPEQIDHARDPNNGAGTIIGKLIFNTVTSLFVGEKEMIRMPTWFFPGGAGPFSESARFTTHGEPDPMATFRFAEPVYIDKQQNFRVELEIPDATLLGEIKKIYGPLFIWVVLDGFMTRDVQ